MKKLHLQLIKQLMIDRIDNKDKVYERCLAYLNTEIALRNEQADSKNLVNFNSERAKIASRLRRE